MYQVIQHDDDRIEIALKGELTSDEFAQVIHQLESLCTMHQNVKVLFDATHLEKYDFKIVLDEYDFFRKYKSNLDRIALVSDSKFAEFVINMFNKFTDTTIRNFTTSQIEQSREWIFPSRLPG